MPIFFKSAFFSLFFFFFFSSLSVPIIHIIIYKSNMFSINPALSRRVCC